MNIFDSKTSRNFRLRDFRQVCGSLIALIDWSAQAIFLATQHSGARISELEASDSNKIKAASAQPGCIPPLRKVAGLR